MIARTDAVLLRTFPFSETSMVASWLSRHHGRVATMIKGAQRPKSHFIGQLDLFYTCEILYYEKESRELHILKECSPIAYRAGLRSDWRACAIASYLSDLFFRISPDQAHHEGLFDFLDRALDHLHTHGARPAFLYWCELKLLDILGLAPRLRQCTSCHRPLNGNTGAAVLAYQQGGVRCASCAETNPQQTVPIAPDVLATLSAWQRSQSAQAALSTHCTPRQQQEIEHLLGLFLRYHLELPLASRPIALDILSRQPA